MIENRISDFSRICWTDTVFCGNIQRINELARKAKAEGLTPAEKEEQQKLRREYIAAVKMNLRTQLDNIDMQEKDGTIVNLGERYGSKRKH